MLYDSSLSWNFSDFTDFLTILYIKTVMRLHALHCRYIKNFNLKKRWTALLQIIIPEVFTLLLLHVYVCLFESVEILSSKMVLQIWFCCIQCFHMNTNIHANCSYSMWVRGWMGDVNEQLGEWMCCDQSVYATVCELYEFKFTIYFPLIHPNSSVKYTNLFALLRKQCLCSVCFYTTFMYAFE